MKKDKNRFPDQSELGYLNLSEHGDFFLKDIIDNPQATDMDEIPGAIGKFGLEASNPIPIHGVPNSRIYLDNLRLRNGSPTSYERMGSMSNPSIEMPIDKYKIYDETGKEITTIFISPYHLKCSEKAPEGFMILDQLMKKLL
ncbi:hypothetical protein Belba_1079 [Belliella baltica DSM 15883]|uniref:Uncharacterized protein n=1 Tax=Belliella baltica (strain DSM 15883 / CIP 108006 / LMG 21964 / BA134) TaxID=866536 RepID=I3Z399_BELBD|nr:hypothetical protein [Belliella baltica]AFL83717.1 hypothetical protein Belba_1079 [Belliella baltica DSM 15883]